MMNDARTLLARLCSTAPTDRLRIAVVVAHPDDEVIGAGALLCEIAPWLLVWTTDGAPRDLADAHRAGCCTREDYARLRRRERSRAAELLGVPRYRTLDLGCADQEASAALEELALQVAALVADSSADVVLTHAYEGGHPDHDATAFAVHAARALLSRQGRRQPPIVELTSYHADADTEEYRVSTFLPNGPAPLVLAVDRDRRSRKLALYGCYASQRAVLEEFPVGEERFRLAPAYDFSEPPHRGVLHYERHPWGMSGARWRELAAAASSTLGTVPQ